VRTRRARSSAIHETSPTLLERLRGVADEAAWRRFVQLYTPLLFYWARRCGESDHDAADLVQEVFATLLEKLPTFQYDRNHGLFRSWLRTLTLNKLRDRKRREAREHEALSQRPAEFEAADGAEAFWETEYQHELARRALELMQAEFAPTTWKACWETVVVGRPADEVARELGVSENAVYIARCRVLRRLREELTGLID
jgi:RNA polymerase sigma-70 factor (ECF subfamily)